jgi:hypothetical protein
MVTRNDERVTCHVLSWISEIVVPTLAAGAGRSTTSSLRNGNYEIGISCACNPVSASPVQLASTNSPPTFRYRSCVKAGVEARRPRQVIHAARLRARPHRWRPRMKTLQDRWTVLRRQHERADPIDLNLTGLMPESWLCVDCGVNTAPGFLNRKQAELAFLLHGKMTHEVTDKSEVYTVKNEIWQATGLEGMGGCLCIGCLEKRIGRRLKPDDFEPGHPFNSYPGTRRLLKRRGR